MEKSSFFNSISGDRKYKADDFAAYFSTFIGNGVFPNPSSNLQVVANNNMSVTIKPGKGWINGYLYVNTDNLILGLEPADGVLNRIDRIALRLDFLKREIRAVVKKGTWSNTPAAVVLQNNSDAVEIGLADIFISKGAINISQANITDTRLDKSLCGIVTGTIDEIDTTTLYNQYAAKFEAKQKDFENDFLTWLSGIKTLLTGDVAASLAAELQTLKFTLNKMNGTVNTVNDSFNKHSSTKEIHRKILYGTDEPTDNVGNEGDIYIQYE